MDKKATFIDLFAGIGGIRLSENFNISLSGKVINPGISNLEINIDALTRKVKLE